MSATVSAAMASRLSAISLNFLSPDRQASQSTCRGVRAVRRCLAVIPSAESVGRSSTAHIYSNRQVSVLPMPGQCSSRREPAASGATRTADGINSPTAYRRLKAFRLRRTGAMSTPCRNRNSHCCEIPMEIGRRTCTHQSSIASVSLANTTNLRKAHSSIPRKNFSFQQA